MPPEFPPYQLSPPSFVEKIRHSWLRYFVPTQVATVGEPAPSFSLVDPRSRLTENDEAYRQKTLVLVFGGTWCVPCQWELRSWIGFHRQYWRENLVIIGVYVDFESDLLSYVRKNKVPYTCCASTSKILWDYGVYPLGKLPRTCIIAPGGTVSWQEDGYHTGADYESKFKPLLGPK